MYDPPKLNITISATDDFLLTDSIRLHIEVYKGKKKYDLKQDVGKELLYGLDPAVAIKGLSEEIAYQFSKYFPDSGIDADVLYANVHAILAQDAQHKEIQIQVPDPSYWEPEGAYSNTWTEKHKKMLLSVGEPLTAEQIDKLYMANSEYAVAPKLVSNTDGDLAALATRLPGLSQKVRYPCPVGCGMYPYDDRLKTVIIHMNDVHKWHHAQVADWLDELADSGKINIDVEDKLFSTELDKQEKL